MKPMTPEDQRNLESARQMAVRTSKGLWTNDLHQINTGQHKFSTTLLSKFHTERAQALTTIREILARYRDER